MSLAELVQLDWWIKINQEKNYQKLEKKTNDFKINELCARKDSLIFRLHKIPRMNNKLKYKK